MARPKEFDPELVMQEAMKAFQANGYTATSVHDLLEEMGLNKGSLYGTFGDKKQLFLAVLDKYYERHTKELRGVIDSAKSPKRALRKLFDQMIEDCGNGEAGRGCLAVKSAMELAPQDKEVAGWFRRFHRRNVQLIADVIREGQEVEEFDKTIDPEAAGKFVLNNMGGLHLMRTTSPSTTDVRQVVDMVFKALVAK